VSAIWVFLSACVGPAPSFGSFEGKAGATAQDMRSVVETGRAAIALAQRERAFGPYLYEVLHDADEDGSSIQSAFDSIQPPDAHSQALRSELDDLLTSAESTLDELRIAARAGSFERLVDLGRPLGQLSAELDRFSQDHPSGGGR
jgi:hypothetical protein